MELTFVQTAGFASAWTRLGLTDDDLQALEQLLILRPKAGAVMRDTGGLRKLRFAPPSWNRGKSGGARVCYVCLEESEACWFLAIYTHAEKDNLSAAERLYFRKLIAAIKGK